MGLVRFYSAVIWIAIALAVCGQLKSCTLAMTRAAGKRIQVGIMSYSKFSRALTK